MNINLKRIYDDPGDDDGARYLVDRLWPRGVSKEDARLDDWFKDAAPSPELRKWYDHDSDKWEEFKSAYREELAENKRALENVISCVKDNKKVTFLYAAKDTKHTHAIVLKNVVQQQIDSQV